MKLIEAAAKKNRGMVRKPSSYFDEYDLWFEPLRNKSLKILEIGVERGGSLYMWKEYFPNAEITGVDVLPRCKEYEGGRVAVEIGSQVDDEFMNRVEATHGPFDIIIDDGSHQVKHQIATFKRLFPKLKMGGLYVVEDIHTSYYASYGGHPFSYTFVDFIKTMIDGIHAWTRGRSDHSLLQRVKNKVWGPFVIHTPYDDIRSIYVASSMCFIKKERVEKEKNLKI